MPSVRIEVPGGSYDVLVEGGAARRAGELARALYAGGGLACIADARVAELHGETVLESLRDAGLRPTVLTIPPGERSKRWSMAQKLLRSLAASGMGRDGLVLALGGGVAGDLAGFVAATYLRGVDFIQIPTTLLAQVDASVGGKTGINLPEGKNLVGAFHQPRLVLCDTSLLATLGVREIRSGLAEALKHGVLADAAYYQGVVERLAPALRRDPEALAWIVAGSCAIKARVVCADEREAGVRAHLNLGHTVAHAIEAAAGYSRFRHGEAVAVGMVAACRLAERMGVCQPGLGDEVVGALRAAGLPTGAPGLAVDALMEAAASDKKRTQGRVRWVLPVRVGKVEVRGDVDDRLVREVLREVVGE